MLAKMAYGCLAIALGAGVVAAQESPKGPRTSDIYCSGIVTGEPVPYDTYLISGEEAALKLTFAEGNLVYINKGASQGVKVDDEFMVMRPVKDTLEVPWYKPQVSMARAMGTAYADLGRLRVVHVQENVSVAEVVFSCASMQRGDIVQPFAERPVPSFKAAAKFDRFAPLSGKPVGMVVSAKGFSQMAGDGSVVYTNLGSTQGVKVGDYIRIYRYQASSHETAFTEPDSSYKMFGFGKTPAVYRGENLPREVLGEGIVLRVPPTASTLLITVGRRTIYSGDHAEIE